MGKQTFLKVISYLMVFTLLFGLMPLNVVAAEGDAGAAENTNITSVVITVVTQDKEAAEGDTASLLPVDGAEVKLGEEVAGVTDASGQVTLSDLTIDQEYTVTVTCEGYAPVSKNFKAEADGSLEMELTPYTVVAVSGSVNCDGAAVAGATVALNYLDGTAITVTTGDDGKFAIAGAYQELIASVTVSGEAYVSKTVSELSYESENVIALEKKAFAISAQVSEQKTGYVTVKETPVIYGEDAVIAISAATDYSIYYITDNGVITAGEASGQQTYEYTIQGVTEAHNVVVYFTQDVKEIHFWVDENGGVFEEVEPQNPQDPVTYRKVEILGLSVEKDKNSGNITVAYAAAENYRVSKVTVDNDDPEEFTENGQDYASEAFTLKEDEMREYVIEVRMDRFSVTIDENETEEDAACVEISAEEVNYGRSSTLKITPPEGKYLSSLTVNGTPVTVSYAGEVPVYVLQDIDEDKVIAVDFAEVEQAQDVLTEVVSENVIDTPADALVDGWNVIYLPNVPSNGSVTIAPINKNAQIARSKNGPYEASLVITDTETVETVYVLQDGVITQATVNVKVVKDTTVPTVEMEESGVKVYGSGFLGIPKVVGIEWSGEAADGDLGSGIDRVVYSKEQNLSADEIKALTTQAEYENGKFTATFGKNDKSTYYFWAIDKAGNVSGMSDGAAVDTDNDAPAVNSFKMEDAAVATFNGKNYVRPGVKFEVVSEDELSDVETAKLQIGDKTYSMSRVKEEKGKTYFEVTVNEVVEGEVSVVISDNSQNANEATYTYADKNGMESFYLIVEDGAPSFVVTSSTAADFETWYNRQDGADVQFVITISDAVSGLNVDEISVSNGKNNIKIDNIVTKEETVTKEEVAEDGTVTSVEEGTGKIIEAIITVSIEGEDEVLSNYDLQIKAEDSVGNSGEFTSEDADALKFNIDSTDPTVTKIDIYGKIGFEDQDPEKRYEGVKITEADVVATDYGYFFQKDTKVKVLAEDTGSGIASIVFYMVPYNAERGSDGALTTPPTEISGEVLYDQDAKYVYAEFDVEEGFRGQIYAYAVDKVGNSSSAGVEKDVHPDSMTIVETQEGHDALEDHIVFNLPESAGMDEMNNPIFTMLQYDTDENGNTVLVTDEEGKAVLAEGIPVEIVILDTFNGVSKISYTVTYPTEEKGKTTVVDLTDKNSGWSIEKDANLNSKVTGTVLLSEESNNIVVEVTMWDNAGNKSVLSCTLSIDNTLPSFEVKHISIEDGDEEETEGYPSEGEEQMSIGATPYFIGFAAKDATYRELAEEYPIFAGGTLQIRLYERNMTKDDLVKSAVKLLAGANLDVFDKVDLTGSIMIGGPYYDVYDEELEETVRHDAKYPYSENVYYVIELQNCTEEKLGGTYVTEFSITDKAGHSNSVKEFFVIDETAPAVSITFDNNEAKNEMYYDAARIATITVVERNFDNETGEITGIASNDGQIFAFPILGGWTSSADMMTHTATVNFSGDGKYENMKASYTDLAGTTGSDEEGTFVIDTTMPEITITGIEDKSANNGTVAPSITYTDTNIDLASVVITLTGANNGVVEYAATITEVRNGQTYLYADFKHEKIVDDIYTLYVHAQDLAGNQMIQTIRFSCNRFGSTFDLSSIADSLGKYNQQVQDIVITETNVDPIDLSTVRITLTKNGTPVDLVQGVDYQVTEVGGEGSWSQYTYSIPSELFADDGTYSLYIYTQDAAGNINENIDDTKEAQISFGVDKTSPIVNPIDFESKTQYAVDGKTVAVEIKDNLSLQDVRIYLNDEEIDYTVEGDSYVFDIPKSNSLQNVRILAVDAAENEQEILVEDFLVTTNIFARWFNNKPLFIGSMVVLAALLGFAGWRFFIILFKKKDEEEEE